MKYTKMTFFALFGLLLIIAIGYGYVANIVSLVTNNEAIGLSIARAIGIFIGPIGVILGYV